MTDERPQLRVMVGAHSDLDGELRRLFAELRRVLAAIWRESRWQAWLWWDSRVYDGGRWWLRRR